jgi:transcription elongation factor GreA
MGDLSENADYSAAKEEQAFVEGRILELTNLLREVIIIDELPAGEDSVNIGSRVTICEQGSDEDEETYMLVGPQETDPKNGRISFDSPIGSALMGHKQNEVVVVSTPGGEIRFKILRVE